VEPKPGEPQVFYRWLDAQGRLHVVSSIEQVPIADRPKASLVVLNGAESVSELGSGSGSAAAWRLDTVSFAIGVAAALILTLVFRALPSSLRKLSRFAIVLGLAALAGAAYLGVVRRSVGMPGASPLTTPSALVEDARRAVDNMNLRQKQQDEEIKKAQAEGR
jgi:hypothetical protein